MAYARAMIKACEKLIKRTNNYKKELEKTISTYDEEINHNAEVMEYYQKEYENLAK